MMKYAVVSRNCIDRRGGVGVSPPQCKFRVYCVYIYSHVSTSCIIHISEVQEILIDKLCNVVALTGATTKPLFQVYVVTVDSHCMYLLSEF